MSEERGKTLLWGGRFTGDGKVDPLMQLLNDSLPIDKRFWSVDIRGSQAYAKALKKANIISQQEADAMVDGLTKVHEEWSSGTFKIQEADEDIHTANERRLSEIIGAGIGGKLHTGRSRNDQVATDLRLWLRDELTSVMSLLRALIQITTERAEKEIDILMPGYTHLQRAQPIRWSHYLLGHCWPWVRDVDRFADLRKRMNKCPLGSGALAGNPLGVDRHFLAKELGFDAPTENSLDAVSDRDAVAEFIFDATMTLTHMSRWAEDMIIYSTAEFGFISLSDTYSTGSSLMPQKKNPDSLELIRSKAGASLGNLTTILVTLKGLPTSYNKDLQEDKRNLFEVNDTLVTCVQIAGRVLDSLRVNSTKMKSALSADMLATDLADYLVRKGLPFRQAHHVVGSVVRAAEKRACALNELSLNELQIISDLFSDDVKNVWEYESSVEKRNAYGGTSSSAVLEQIQQLKKWLNT